jgi:hypothetical protein
VLEGDTSTAATLLAAGYAPLQRHLILQRKLGDFRPSVDRQSMQRRRQFRLEPIPDTAATMWYDICAWCWVERDRFAVVPVAGGAARATLTFWDMEPLSSSWAVRAVGFLPPDSDGIGLPPDDLFCFLAEAMRYFQSQGMNCVEVQLAESDLLLRDGYARLGFLEVDRGTQFHKPA